MVGWFDPGQLARTGLEVVVSTLFGRHSDFRLLEALVPQSGECPFFDHTYNYNTDADGRYVDLGSTSPRAESEMWIDYVSDVGDGWNPTYTMAYYLGLPGLDLQLPANRGKISINKEASSCSAVTKSIRPRAARCTRRDWSLPIRRHISPSESLRMFMRYPAITIGTTASWRLPDCSLRGAGSPAGKLTKRAAISR